MPLFQAPSGGAGEGWRSASHCPTGDLSPGTHPHPQPRPGKGWAQRGCSRRRLAENPASGERKGLGEGVGEETEEAKGSATRPDADPVEGPRPQGRPRSSDSPLRLWDFCRDEGPGAVPLQSPSLRLGLKEEHGAARTGWGTAPQRPWVGWVRCRLREGALSKWKPGPRNGPGHSGCTAPGKTLLLTERCPNPGERRLANERAGRGLGG